MSSGYSFLVDFLFHKQIIAILQYVCTGRDGSSFYAQRALKLELRRIIFLLLEGMPILGATADAMDGADFCSSWAAWSLSFMLTTLRSAIMLKLMRSGVTGWFIAGAELVAIGAGVEDAVAVG